MKSSKPQRQLVYCCGCRVRFLSAVKTYCPTCKHNKEISTKLLGHSEGEAVIRRIAALKQRAEAGQPLFAPRDRLQEGRAFTSSD